MPESPLEVAFPRKNGGHTAPVNFTRTCVFSKNDEFLTVCESP